MRKNLIVTAALLVAALVGWQVARSVADDKAAAQPTLTDAAKKAVEKAFPKATVAKIEAEQAGVTVHEVDLKVNGKEASVVVAPDGTVLSLEMELAADALPAAVKATVDKEAAGAKITLIEKEEKLAAAKIVKLDKAKVVYEVKMTKGDKAWEVKMDGDGKVLGKKDVTGEKD